MMVSPPHKVAGRQQSVHQKEREQYQETEESHEYPEEMQTVAEILRELGHLGRRQREKFDPQWAKPDDQLRAVQVTWKI